jgi:hypothetical protein
MPGIYSIDGLPRRRSLRPAGADSPRSRVHGLRVARRAAGSASPVATPRRPVRGEVGRSGIPTRLRSPNPASVRQP